MKRAIQSLHTILLALACGLATSVRADVEVTLALPDFNETESAEPLVYTSGSAAVTAGGVRLNEPIGTRGGAAYYKLPVTLSAHRSFSAYFTFRITKPHCKDAAQSGADGLAFIIQPDRDRQGRAAGGVGYQGIPQSVAVEFDTFHNLEYKDPVKNHVGISVNGSVESVATAEVPFTLNDGTLYHAWVDYDGKADELQARIATTAARPATPTLSHKVDLEAALGSEQYVGITASTGACWEQHDVYSLYFNADNFVQGIDTTIEKYVMAGR